MLLQTRQQSLSVLLLKFHSPLPLQTPTLLHAQEMKNCQFFHHHFNKQLKTRKAYTQFSSDWALAVQERLYEGSVCICSGAALLLDMTVIFKKSFTTTIILWSLPIFSNVELKKKSTGIHCIFHQFFTINHTLYKLYINLTSLQSDELNNVG